jgi:hypothetical protein
MSKVFMGSHQTKKVKVFLTPQKIIAPSFIPSEHMEANDCACGGQPPDYEAKKLIIPQSNNCESKVRNSI